MGSKSDFPRKSAFSEIASNLGVFLPGFPDEFIRNPRTNRPLFSSDFWGNLPDFEEESKVNSGENEQEFSGNL